MNDKICVVFIRNSLEDVGGIETYIYKSMRYIISNGDIPIWISNDFSKINASYEKILLSEEVRKITRINLKKYLEKILIHKEVKHVLIVTFCPYDFVYAEIIKKVLLKFSISTFIFVPHFMGEFLYLEDAFFLRNFAQSKLGNIYRKLEKNANIRYFSEIHLEEFRKRYRCNETNFSNVSVPKISEKKFFDINRINKIYNREKFIILSVSRLDFPHKGYILGLIDVFVQLFRKYDFMKLIIVGDGKDKSRVIKKIKKIDSKISKEIILTGAVAPNELNAYYDNANLLISLAGSFTLGASRGVLSLPARHYTEKCEVYGYLPQSKKFTLSSETGKDVTPFIEEIINMSYDDYLKYCKECFNTYQNKNIDSYFNEINNNSKKTISYISIIYIMFFSIYSKVKYCIKKYYEK